MDGKVSSQCVLRHTALRRVQAPGLCSGNKRSRLKGRKRQLPGGGDSQKESTNNQESYPFCTGIQFVVGLKSRVGSRAEVPSEWLGKGLSLSKKEGGRKK